METREGQKLPFLFPDSVTHLYVAMAMSALVKSTMNTEAKAVSAGFVSIGTDVSVSGESESLGGLKSIPSDAARIVVGECLSFMPDSLATMMLEKLRGADKE